MAGMFDTGANALLGIGQNTVQPQTNLLQNIAAAQDIKNQALAYSQNALAMAAKKATGAAYAHNYNALTGEYNMPGVQSEMAQSPAGQYGLPDAVTTIRNQQGKQVSNDTDQLQLANASRNAVGSVLSFVGSNPDAAHLSAGEKMAKAVLPKSQWGQVNAVVQQIAQHPDGIQGGVKQLVNSMQGAEGQQGNVYGKPGATVDNGQQVIIGTQGSAMTGGQFRPSTTVQKQVGPESNAIMLPVTMKDPDTGQMITFYRPAGQLRQSTGDGNFTGRRINTAGGASEPMDGAPAGYNEQYKTGQDVQNSLANQQNAVTQNIATLRNLDSLLFSIPQNARSRKLKDITNNLNKFGIGGKDAERYATLAQEIDKAGTTLRKQMMDSGGGPHTNAGLSDLEHITPGMEMTPTAARALTNEMLTATLYQQGRQKIAAGEKDPTKVLSTLADYDQNFDPRFATIQRLGPEEGREYARTHIADKKEYAEAVRRMARAQREKGYDYGLTPQQVDRILGLQNGR